MLKECGPRRAGRDSTCACRYRCRVSGRHPSSTRHLVDPIGRREVACALRPDMAAGQRGAFGGDHGNQMISVTAVTGSARGSRRVGLPPGQNPPCIPGAASQADVRIYGPPASASHHRREAAGVSPITRSLSCSVAGTGKQALRLRQYRVIHQPPAHQNGRRA